MKSTRVSGASIWLAFFMTSCFSGGGDSPDNTAQPGTGGSSSATAGAPTGSAGATGAKPGATGKTGGATGKTGGATGKTGGATGKTGGATGKTGGATGKTGGATGKTGGAMPSATSTGAATTGPVGSTAPSTSTSPSSSSTGTPEPSVPEPKLITSADGAFWKTDGTVTEEAGTATFTVTDAAATAGNTFDGFGGSFNENGWIAMAKLSATDRTKALKLLFDKADGAGFVFGRIPVGSSDYSRDRYSLNEMAGDYAMTNFSIARDKEALIPFIKAALEVNKDIKFWGSPWSPPTWMKDNGMFDKGNMKTDDMTLQAHALYLSKFVTAYEAEGIKIVAMAAQNEAGWSQNYPSCAWTPAQMTGYIGKFLGPTLKTNNPDTGIWLGTLSNATTESATDNNHPDALLGTAVLADATAKAFIKAAGLQWSMVDKVSDYTGKGFPVYQTEHEAGNNPWQDTYKADKAPNDMAYGVVSWGLLKKWIDKGVNGYSAWNMVLDTVGHSLDVVRPWAQNALLAVDTAAGTLQVTPTYYVFRHISQYVDPGATRLAVSGEAVAFKNPDGTYVTVMYNADAAAKASVLSVGGKSLKFTIPAKGWATVNWK